MKLDDHKNFAYMGQLNEILLSRRITRKALGLTVHSTLYPAFVQLSPVTPPLHLCPREVGSYRWVDFRTFTHEFQERFHPQEMEISGPALRPFSQAVNLISNGKLTIRFAGIDLPPSKIQASAPTGDQQNVHTPYQLWGITYGVTSKQRLRALVKCLNPQDKTNSEKEWGFYMCKAPWQFLTPVLRGVDRVLGPERVNPAWAVGAVIMMGAVGVSVGLVAGVSYVA